MKVSRKTRVSAVLGSVALLTLFAGVGLAREVNTLDPEIVSKLRAAVATESQKKECVKNEICQSFLSQIGRLPLLDQINAIEFLNPEIAKITDGLERTRPDVGLVAVATAVADRSVIVGPDGRPALAGAEADVAHPMLKLASRVRAGEIIEGEGLTMPSRASFFSDGASNDASGDGTVESKTFGDRVYWQNRDVQYQSNSEVSLHPYDINRQWWPEDHPYAPQAKDEVVLPEPTIKEDQIVLPEPRPEGASSDLDASMVPRQRASEALILIPNLRVKPGTIDPAYRPTDPSATKDDQGPDGILGGRPITEAERKQALSNVRFAPGRTAGSIRPEQSGGSTILTVRPRPAPVSCDPAAGPCLGQ